MKRRLKQHLMNVVAQASEPRLAGLEQQIVEQGRQLDAVAQRLARVEAMLDSHLPRPSGQPGFLAQFNLSDILAWRAGQTSAQFVDEYMPMAQVVASRHDNLLLAASRAAAEGVVLEFGVAGGQSLRWLEQAMPDHRVVGFDSFEGLPEDWRPGFSAGTFEDAALGDVERAELHIGLFEATLPGFVADLEEPIALLHIDCDLYSSTVTVLEHCGPFLTEGTVVVFDEFFNYQGWQEHEAKAWLEYVDAHGLEVSYLGYVPASEQVSVRVDRAPWGSPPASVG